MSEVRCLNYLAMNKLLILLLKLYQLVLSPVLGPACRFYPSCSAYLIEAIQKHGTLQGLLLGMARLSRCHPFHAGGFDPVPEKTRLSPKTDSDYML